MAAGAVRFKVCSEGTCSFCGDDLCRASSLVGSTVMDVCICDRCLGICCDVLAEAVGAKVKGTSASAWPVRQVSTIVAEVRAKAARGELPPGSTKGRPDGSVFHCNFCGTDEKDAAKLVNGAVTQLKIALNSINSDRIVDGTIIET